MAAAKKKSDEIKFTKYEKARIVGSRALQISMGAPFTVKISKKELESMGYNPVNIAKKEFEAGSLPLSVVRLMPWEKRETQDWWEKLLLIVMPRDKTRKRKGKD